MKNHVQPYCRNFSNRYWRRLAQDQTAPFQCQVLQESLLAQLCVDGGKFLRALSAQLANVFEDVAPTSLF